MENEFIPLSVPNLKGNELEYVTNAVKTEWVSTAGKYVELFEEHCKKYVNCAGAVSCQNGTSGIHIALLIANVLREDAVIVPTLTFIAAVNPVKYIGAEPIFMDCDDSLCMDPEKLKLYCEKECRFVDGKLLDNSTGRHIKALIVVHVFGNMADMEAFIPIANKYNLTVIEDATEALGTYYMSGVYEGKYAGTIGDLGVYSFNGNKIITTGGGGMIVSNNEQYLKRAKHLTTQAKSDELYYTHDEIGYNYRMTNLQAALGLAQLEQLEEFIAIKTSNYKLYQQMLGANINLELLSFRDNIRSNHWFYGINTEGYKYSRDELIQYLSKNSIQSRPIWGLINEQLPYSTSKSFKIERAKYFWKYIINIPCSSNLTSEQIKRVVTSLV